LNYGRILFYQLNPVCRQAGTGAKMDGKYD